MTLLWPVTGESENLTFRGNIESAKESAHCFNINTSIRRMLTEELFHCSVMKSDEMSIVRMNYTILQSSLRLRKSRKNVTGEAKQAVRHSNVKRRESLQHKMTLRCQHKTWLLLESQNTEKSGSLHEPLIAQKWPISVSQKAHTDYFV